MTKNIGSTDKLIRIIVGIILISLVFVGPKSLWGWVGVIPIATALVNFCPMYNLLGFKTSSQ